MQPQTKVLISTIIIGGLYLISTYFSAIRSSLFYFYPIAILFYFSILGIYFYLIKHKEYKEKLTPIKKEESPPHSTKKISSDINPEFTRNKKTADLYEDNLTHLPNRIFFNDALNKAISHAKRRNKILAVLIVDIDDFQKINKNKGTYLGDQVLNETAHRLSSILRTEDIVARLEGDKFIILLNDIVKPKFASVVAEKILKACAIPIKKDISTSVSIGISIYPNDGNSLEELLENTDAALYKTKQAGGNSYQFHTQTMNLEAREFIELEKALQNAITNNELLLYYQPKLHLKKGSIRGVEALLRWASPQLGLLMPAQFISVAEDTGFISKLGEWALHEACKTNKYWQDEGYEHLTVSLNLSPKQFQDPHIAEKISQILKATELNPQYLELEINEATIMENMELAMQQLEKIKATGVQLSIDHFGTGYTSISHLKQFPISAIKIDQTYIKGVPNNPNDSAITNAFIALAHQLGLEVIAEGVETSEQVQYLTKNNCDMIQGYFLSHPLPAQKIVQQFKKLMDRALF